MTENNLGGAYRVICIAWVGLDYSFRISSTFQSRLFVRMKITRVGLEPTASEPKNFKPRRPLRVNTLPTQQSGTS